MSVEKLITDHIAIWASAVQIRSTAGRGNTGKIDQYGIKKLRELILELAVRGRLVPQDPNDEPASELIKRISAEKAELVKQGKIKKQKPLTAIGEKEKPYKLPEGWEWVRLGQITSYGSCDKIEPEDASDEVWVLELEDIEKETSRLIKKINFHERPFKSSKNKFCKNEVLYGKLRPYLDKVIVADSEGVCTTEIVPIKTHGGLNPYYLRLLLKTPSFIKYANGSTHGMNLPRLGTENAVNAIFAIAPLKEQERILETFNKLMLICGELEQYSSYSLNSHQQLVETLLATLTSSHNAEELKENWSRISEHFDTLLTTEASIDALKQIILQLAVMGKLVPQDPNDEPASELLKRIEQEKAQRVKAGKIKKQKPLPPVSDQEKAFELPNGWEWCRLGDCIYLISGQHLKPDEYTEDKADGLIPYITGPAEFGEVSPNISKYTMERRAVAEPKDILITCKGAGLGKLNIADREIAISRQLMAVRPVCVNQDYFRFLLLSMYDYFQSKGVGIAIPGISREDVIEAMIPLPPSGEQKAIADFVISMYGIIKYLKVCIYSAQQTQLHLADALTDIALN